MDAQANQNTKEPLHYVSRKDVPRLVKSLEAQGPEALTVLSFFLTMLDWWEKNDAYQCTILAPEGGEDRGVCVVILSEYELKRMLMFAPEHEMARFFKSLEETYLIPWDSIGSVCRLIKWLKEPLVKLLEAKGYNVQVNTWNNIMMMSPDDVLALKENKLPNNVSLRDLTVDDSFTLAKKWKYGGQDSLSITREGLKYNGGIGAMDEDGELIAWIVWNRWGCLGQLYVSPSHRRLGLGRLLAIQMSKRIAKKGRVVTAEIERSNATSLTLFQSIGFRYDFLDCYLQLLRVK